MQVYVIDTYSHIGQGGRKEREWPKGVNQRVIFFGLVFGSKGFRNERPYPFQSCYAI